MTATIAQTVGVDICKLTLDVYLHPQASARQFPNTTAGIKALLAWLGQTPLHRVIFEPTGAYHRDPATEDHAARADTNCERVATSCITLDIPQMSNVILRRW